MEECAHKMTRQEYVYVWVQVFISIAPGPRHVHIMAWSVCSCVHPRESQRKEIAAGTQFISSCPPAKSWQTPPGHNPHVVNHASTSLGRLHVVWKAKAVSLYSQMPYVYS